jgi:ABC-2 type transport system permease protein
MSAPELAIAAPEPQRYGEVYDRGYKHYDGERLGRKHAFWALVCYSIQRALGLKKRWTAKIVPIIIYVVAAGSVLIMIGLEAFLDETTMNYAEFYVFIFATLGLFVATCAPEMLCSDRRENVLALYFSRAITRLDYVLAKLFAMAILTLTVSLVPHVLLWLFRQLIADNQAEAFKNSFDDLGKIVITGTLIAFYLGSIGLVISSFTKRKPIAIAIIIVGWVITESFIGIFTEAVQDRTWSKYLDLFSPLLCARDLAFSLLTEPSEREFEIPFEWWWYAAAMLATIVIACAVMVWRYVPED